MPGIPSPPLALFVVVLPKAHCRKWLKISRKWLKENLGLCLIEIFSIYSAESGIWWGSETLFKPFFSSRYICEVGFPGCASVKELACQCMPPEEETANPLQYSYLEISMDRGAWRATVHGATKSGTWLKQPRKHRGIWARKPLPLPPLFKRKSKERRMWEKLYGPSLSGYVSSLDTWFPDEQIYLSFHYI